MKDTTLPWDCSDKVPYPKRFLSMPDSIQGTGANPHYPNVDLYIISNNNKSVYFYRALSRDLAYCLMTVFN